MRGSGLLAFLFAVSAAAEPAALERLAGELRQNGVDARFDLVPGGEHLNAYLLHAPQIFDFLENAR